MSIVADFSVPAEAFCLATALESSPETTVEPDRLVAHSPNYVMPFCWIRDEDLDGFDEALATDPTVEEATVTDSFDEARLYQISWAEEVGDRLDVFLDHEGAVLEARGSDGTWRFLVRFGSRDHFDEFREHFEEEGHVTLHRLTEQRTSDRTEYGVSKKQREALLAAHDVGYFDFPRSGTAEAVAERLDVSPAAVSERLRRGTATLIEHTLGRRRDDE